MATYYVNKSGSDSNNGTTPTLAKLTIGAAIYTAASGDSIIVGSGSYNERISWANKALNIYADGIVVLDGTGVGGSGVPISYTQSGSGGFTNNILPYTTGGKWIIQNHNISNDLLGNITITNVYASGGQGSTLNINSFEIYCNINAKNGIVSRVTSGTSIVTASVVASNCVIIGYGAYGMYASSVTSNSIAYIKATNCTFYNCSIAMFASQYCLLNGGIYYNIFHTNTTNIKTISTPTYSLINYNIHHNQTNLLTVNTTNYTTLSAVQALGSELNGFAADPGLIDPANGVFYLSSIGNYGAYPYSAITRGASYNPDSKWIITAAKDDTGWYCAGGNITKSGVDGAFELSAGTSDTIESPVFDNGINNTTNSLISIASDQTWPTHMADKTKTDIRPNYQTVEIRSSNTAFVQADASPSWVEVNIESPITQIGRYVQLRITLRNDDVAG
jgi:hypothetical protein